MNKINTFIEKNIVNIIKYFLLIGPLVDVITSLQINNMNSSFSLGIVFKFLILFILMYYHVFIKNFKNKYIIIYMFLMFIYCFLYLFIVNSFSFSNLSGLFRIMFFPLSLILIYFILKEKKQTINKKTLRFIAIFYSLLIIIPVLTGTAFDSYAVAKKGSLGWFNSANEISAILAILLPLMFYYTFDKFKIYKLFILTLVIITIFVVGTKTPLVSLLLCIVVFFAKFIIKCFKQKKYKRLVSIFVIALTGMVFSVIIIPKTYIYKNTMIHLEYLEINKVSELLNYKTIDHFAFGQRLSFLEENNREYNSSNVSQKILGIGFNNNDKLVEMDFFDVFYRTGIVGIILFLMPLIILLKDYKYFEKKYLTSILMILFSSFLAGHVVTAPSVSIIVSVILCNSFLEKTSKKNVVITAYDLRIGGIETSLINLLKNFNYDKYDVTLVLEKKQGVFITKIPKTVKVKEYKVFNSNNLLVRKVLNLLKQISWIIKYGDYYDVGICYATYSLPGVFIVQNTSLNKILYIHSNYKNLYKNNIQEIKKFFNDRKLTNFNKIIFVSNESKKDLIKIYPQIKNKSYVINNLIDYESILKKAKQKIDIKKNGLTILFVGRLEEDSKKITRILEVAKMCKKNKDKINFWIVGDGPDTNIYKNYIGKEKLNNVVMFGAKSNPYPYIKECDYVILTSRYEGFPVVYNEAIILNKPILTTVNVTDESISIKDRFGIILKQDSKAIYETVKKLTKEQFVVKEKINFENVNKNRILSLEKVMENK